MFIIKTTNGIKCSLNFISLYEAYAIARSKSLHNIQNTLNLKNQWKTI